MFHAIKYLNIIHSKHWHLLGRYLPCLRQGSPWSCPLTISDLCHLQLTPPQPWCSFCLEIHILLDSLYTWVSVLKTVSGVKNN